jgi:endonuclease/exonuclease/phosphatase family metal-dependent hydrolase
MRAAILGLGLLVTGCGADESVAAGPRPLGVMSFNVLCYFCGDDAEYDPWEQRLAHFGDIFARHAPDLIGLQELAPKTTLPTNVQEMLSVAPGFEALTYVQENGVEYPDSTILYRSERLTPLEHGTYWLGPDPDEPFSNGLCETQTAARTVEWARLLDAAGRRELVFVTTHFDANSPCQERSAPILLERTAPFAATHPIVVTGDFNATPSDPAFTILTEDPEHSGLTLGDTQALADGWSVVTNLDPPPEYDLGARIDHVFVGGAASWHVMAWSADLTAYGAKRRYPSDHRPIIALLGY